MSVVLACQNSRKDHMRKPCTKNGWARGVAWNLANIFTSSRMRTKLRFLLLLKPGQCRRPLRKDRRTRIHSLFRSINAEQKRFFRSEELDTLRRSRNHTVVVTANGDVQKNEEAQVNVRDESRQQSYRIIYFAQNADIPMRSQRAKTTVDQRGEDSYLQNLQFRTACRSRYVRQFW